MSYQQFYRNEPLIMCSSNYTMNMGMVNTLAAIESGISKAQSTLGGLGGCPFAPRQKAAE